MNKSLELLKSSKKDDITEEMIVNVWLEEFYNTTIDQISDQYQKDENGDYAPGENIRFYNEHKVTREQYIWWEREIKAINKGLDKSWWYIYLNTAPL